MIHESLISKVILERARRQFICPLARTNFFLTKKISMFFLPYKDDNPTRSAPVVNWILIIANLWVFFTWQFPLGPKEQAAYFSSFGFIPATFFGQFFYPSVEGIIWEWYSVVTSMFSHGGIAHLFGNMLFLYLYGITLRMLLGNFVTSFSIWGADCSLPWHRHF